MGEERNVLTAPALMEALILGQRQLKFKGGKDANSITEVAGLKAMKRTEFGHFIGRFSKFRKTRVESNRNEARN